MTTNNIGLPEALCSEPGCSTDAHVWIFGDPWCPAHSGGKCGFFDHGTPPPPPARKDLDSRPPQVWRTNA